MYHPISIHKLSENQLSRLRNGHPVRIKMGSHHKVHLTAHQIKKLHQAHNHGKASTVTFDPYQMEAHGSGVFGDIARGAKAFVQKHHLQNVVNPLINGIKKSGHQTIERISRAGHHGIKRGSHLAHSYLNQLQPIEGHGIHDKYKLHVMPRHEGQGLGGLVLNGAAGLSNLIGGNGSGEAADVLRGIGGVANFMGLGVARKHHSHHKPKPKTKKHHGKGFLEDIGQQAKHYGKELAKSGVRLGSNYVQNKIEGLGVLKPKKRIVGRRRKTGGALMAAGY